LLVGKKSYEHDGMIFDDKPLIINTIVKTTETESVTSLHKITEENINLWKDLKDPHMKDVIYGATQKPEILVIPGENRLGEFEIQGRSNTKPILTRDASNPAAPLVFEGTYAPTNVINNDI